MKEEAGEVDTACSSEEEEEEEGSYVEEEVEGDRDLVDDSTAEDGCRDDLEVTLDDADEFLVFVAPLPPVTAVGSGILPVKLAALFQSVLVGAAIV